MKYGFVGLGQMGAPMAANLAQRYDGLVMDRKATAQDALTLKGVRAADQPDDFARVDVLILCLPAPQQVNDVLFDTTNGLARHLQDGAIVIDTGTIEYGATIEIGARLADAGLRFLDAPVSGMQKRAEDGTLTMMVGGDADVLSEVHAGLSTMASKILHMGGVGSGQLTKLVNQLLFDINAAALAEILPMSVKLGLDPDKIGAVVNSGTGRSYASEFFVPHILRRDFGNGYAMQEAYKDLISGAKISAEHALPTPVLAAATATYQQALKEGHGEKDKGAMILVYERLLGMSFQSRTTKG